MRLSAAKAAEHIAPRYRILARYIIANICQFALLFTDQLSKQSRIGYGHQRSLPRNIRPNPGIGHPCWANYFPVTRAVPEPPSIRQCIPGPAIGPNPAAGEQP